LFYGKVLASQSPAFTRETWADGLRFYNGLYLQITGTHAEVKVEEKLI
jgi:hypothetical protein